MNRRKFLLGLASSALAAKANSGERFLMPSDVPNEYGFRIMWFNPGPAVDPKTYFLDIGGLVEKPVQLSLDDLRKFPYETQSSRLKCVQCWSARATWGGFRFGEIVELVKPKKNARAVRFDCYDTWYEYFDLEDLLSPRVLLALDMNGKPLPDNHGFPLRLIDPRKYGYKSAKLIKSITFVEEGKGSMACDIGPYYSPTGEILPGYDTPLDLDGKKRRIKGGEITEY